jgi:hypothetical protein
MSMIKPLLGLAATGVVAVVAWKLMVLLLLPLIGVAIGIAAVVIKVMLLLLLFMIAFWLYRRTVGSPEVT